MSTLHILEADAQGNYRVAIHTPVPVGNNAAGLAWKTVALAAGRTGTTVLTEGTGPGQVSVAEKATIVSGDVAEIVTMLPIDSTAWTPAKIAAQIKTLTDQWITKQAHDLNRYGQVV
jgi:hypothetical protein